MLRDLIKWLLKLGLSMSLWVFLLSVEWEERTLFDRAHQILIENPVVELLDEELSRLWQHLSLAAIATYGDMRAKMQSQEQEEEM